MNYTHFRASGCINIAGMHFVLVQPRHLMNYTQTSISIKIHKLLISRMTQREKFPIRRHLNHGLQEQTLPL